MSSLFCMQRPLLLASSSLRRQEFLQNLGISFQVVTSSIEEPTPTTNENPETYVLRSCISKVQGIEVPVSSVILSADTVVSLNGKIFGKPKSEESAYAMLCELVGKKHSVFTAVNISDPHNDKSIQFVEKSDVYFGDWSDDILKAYAYSGEPLDKAGAYAIQGKGSFLSYRIEGAWDTVVGLPLSRTVQALMDLGVIGPVS